MFQEFNTSLSNAPFWKKALIGGIVIISLILICRGLFGYRIMHPAYDGGVQSTISVSGTGEVNVSPDIAQFSFAIEKTAKTMAEAQEQMSTQANALVAKLKAAGIADKDIKTEGFNAYPKYETKQTSIARPCTPTYCPPWDGGNQIITGYTVSHNYSVKVRDLDQVNDIAKLITDANVSSLYGPNFMVDDMEAVKNQARALAIADAKAQAKVLASQLGVRLGKIVDFQVSGDGMYPMYDTRVMSVGSAMKEEAVAPDIQIGETDVTVNVTVTYRIR